MIALPRNLKHLALAFALFPLSAQADTVRIYVTNSAGDSVHVIDAATNKVVQVFKGPEAMHGIGFAPDGSRVYVSSESQSTLDVFDRGAMSNKAVTQITDPEYTVEFDGKETYVMCNGVKLAMRRDDRWVSIEPGVTVRDIVENGKDGIEVRMTVH